MIPGIIVLAGIAVLIGHYIENDFLMSVATGMVCMKVDTAMCFIMVGIMLMGISLRNIQRQTVVVIMSSGFVFVSLILSVLHGYLFSRYPVVANYSVAPGVPSLGTIILFVCISAVGMKRVFDDDHMFCAVSRRIGTFVILASMCALLGYAIRTPWLYFYVPEASTGMAMHTAILFILSGIHILYLANKFIDPADK